METYSEFMVLPVLVEAHCVARVEIQWNYALSNISWDSVQ